MLKVLFARRGKYLVFQVRLVVVLVHLSLVDLAATFSFERFVAYLAAVLTCVIVNVCCLFVDTWGSELPERSGH